MSKEVNIIHENDTLIYDNIHAYIEVDSLAMSIIDTPEFQRLRRIHQGGVLHYVFPTANHCRFEHSIGTYYLAKKFINNLKDKQPELNITNKIVNIVSIAGLCHDLGHLMYSHLFDDLFLPMLPNFKELGDLVTHEIRSISILKHIVKKYNIKISDDEILVIQDLIYPKNNKYDNWLSEFKIGSWIFQIISNPINNVDVDKFDYINRDNRAVGLKLDVDFSRLIIQARVIDNEICYPIQAKESLYHLFFIRYQLHRRIYSHKTVKAVEILISQLLFELEKIDKISDKLKNIESMMELVDCYIFNNKNERIVNLINQIETRKLPSLVFEKISLEEFIFSEDILNSFNKESYEIIYYKVGYTSGKNQNPLSNIRFYKPKNNEIIHDITIQDFSLLTNDYHQEYVCRIYCKDNTIKDELYNCLN